jgi:hypothetical protein
MKIPFKNCRGQVVRLDGKLTVEDLVRMGIKVSMTPKRKRLPRDPRIFVHQAK